jgi:hypothetical protein
MRPIELLGVILTGLASAAIATPSAEINDLAARVHYGFYHGEPRAVAAALVGLERLPDTPEVAYQRDFAALRAAQLGDAGRDAQRRLSECVKRGVDAKLPAAAAAEAWALVAACAFVAGDGRRLAEALAAARRADSDHPRAALVEAWAFERDAGARPAEREAVGAKWASVVAAFDEFAPTLDDPGWGHAEALVRLANTALARGEIRTARDLAERALLYAPDYEAALALRERLVGGAGSNSAP